MEQLSNQEGSQKFPDGHPKDTIFLHEILKLWLNKNAIDFELICQPILAHIPLNEIDQLFEFYFQFFNEIRTKEEKLRQQGRFPQINDTVFCQVTEYHPNFEGVFVETRTGQKGFIHCSNVSQQPIVSSQIPELFKIGDVVVAQLIKRDGANLKLSIKDLEDKPGEFLIDQRVISQRIQQQMKLNQEQLSPDKDILLISVKGGTGQMKTALQLQGISLSAIKKLLFINPILSIKGVFSGLPSECELESSWRYMRTQKYQTVRQLLERWDFDGAIEIIKNWREYLDFLINQGILDQDEVEKSNQLSQILLLTLDFSRTCFNLDFQTAEIIADQGINATLNYSEYVQKTFLRLKKFTQEYNASKYRLLNLYTRNRISWQLDQNAIFLTFLSSFCEETVQGLILKWDKNANYWQVEPEALNLEVDVAHLKRIRKTQWEVFVSLQRQYNSSFAPRETSSFKLGNRFYKRNFAEAIVRYRNNYEEIEAWSQLCINLQQLDFWIEKRNELIHSAKGLSRQLMWELYNNYTPKSGEINTCNPDEILSLMASIVKNKLINLSIDSINQFVVGEDANYYIHSFVRDWVLRQLTQDGLQ